jgi:hypothetical protein
MLGENKMADIPLTISRTDSIETDPIVLAYASPLDEMSKVQQWTTEVLNDATDALPDTPPTFERSIEYYIDRMMLDETEWSFARVMRQALIMLSAGIASIALSVGRYVDDSVKKKYRGYLLRVAEYPQASTTVSIGTVNRYMPLGWYAFYRDITIGAEVTRYYGPITFIYTICSVVMTLDTRYDGLHVEPSLGVTIDTSEI